MGQLLEPPAGNHLVIWNILLSRYVLRLVAVADEMGVFAALAEAPLCVDDAALRFGLTREWAEILLGSLAALELTRAQDGRFGLTPSAQLPGTDESLLLRLYLPEFCPRRQQGRTIAAGYARGRNRLGSLPGARLEPR